MKKILLLPAIFVLCALQTSTQETIGTTGASETIIGSAATLSGLRGVTLKLTVLPDDASLHESIRQSVEAALRHDRVLVFEGPTGPDVAALQVYVLNSQDVHQRSVVVRQPVTLVRNPKATLLLPTWSTEGNGCGAISESGVRASVLRMIEDFIRDFRAANPR